MRQAPAAAPFLTAAALLLPLLLAPACGSPGVGGAVADAPIAAPAEQWSWIDFDNAVCGSGQRTGLAVNPTDRTRDVVVYFLGGGACWDEQSCFVERRAAFLDGFTDATFAGFRLGFAGTPLDRALPGNPFRDASLVFVPYCTGDLHAGTTVNAYGARVVHHAGADNVAAYLRRLAATFPGARRVFVTGSSAGGYGAQLNYERFAEAFPEAEVHLLADSAQAVAPAPALYATWLDAWRPVLPPGCDACATDLAALPAWLAGAHPGRRFGLLAFLQDTVLPGYFDMTPAAFEAGTRALLASPAYDQSANGRYFARPGPGHVMLDGDLSDTVDGVVLRDWLAAWREGTGWQSAPAPPPGLGAPAQRARASR